MTAAAHGEPERAPGGTVEVTMPDTETVPLPLTVNGRGSCTLLGKPAAAATTAAVSVGPAPEPMPRPDDECNGGNVDGDVNADDCGGCGGCGVCAAFVDVGVVGDEAARRVETAFCTNYA